MIAKEKLETMKSRFSELSQLIADPSIVQKQDEWKKYVKEYATLQPIVDAYYEYLKLEESLEECRIMMKNNDSDLAEMAEIEYYEIRDKKELKENDIKLMLLPSDPMDEKNVILEIRPGAGGEESGLFAFELLRMYKRFAERLKWKAEDMEINETELGGLKEAVIMITGKGAYSKLKYESGAHRVQRVPETESQGRVHTSTATVAVLPEAEDVDVEISEKDLKIDTYRSGGAGGQHVNKTESAIRITHLPTGIIVACQDERSQMKNRDRAMKILKSRIYEFLQSEKDKQYAENRRIQVGTGDRSERIRTYNYPQGRVTDHRISMTLYSLNDFLDGNMFEIIEALALADRNKKLQSQ
jgi:peptide chain release factor 1